ncbi:DUF421 domain-containing protein [Wukongibacter baidiensis]|uniref:DUF421 domain-containing protein n=1 Tax=Wukongibacter baidiensis TaxID=1723361 RepID=UPI003D7F42FC
MNDWIEILLRSTFLFFLVLILVRIMGKRQIARMTPFHFVSYSVIGILAALISANIIKNIAFGFIALGVWILFSIALDYLSLRSKVIHDLVNGRETILVKQGKVMEENLKDLRLTGEELLKELRFKNVFNLADVEFAVMEPTGEMNVLLKSEKTPVTPYDLGKKVSPRSAPQTVILDGNIIDESLSNMGLNQRWLNTQLEGMGISLDNVFIGQVDSSGDLYVDLFDDSIQIPEPKVKEMLYANLEKSQADLLTFSLETENEQAKSMYATDAEKLQKILEKLKPYLLR